MITEAIHIEMPPSGEYKEKIYEANGPLLSTDWTWIKFLDDNEYWCGEFRGKYIGAAISTKLEVVVIITSDYIYAVDCNTSSLIDFKQNQLYADIIATPTNEIFLVDGSDIYTLTGTTFSSIKKIESPFHADCLRFQGICNNTIKVSFYDDWDYGKELEAYYDYDAMLWKDDKGYLL